MSTATESLPRIADTTASYHPYRRMVIVGGGSLLWTPVNVARMACSPSTRDARIVLYDVDHGRAQETAELTNRMLARGYAGIGLQVTAAATLDEALPGAEVVMTCYCVGGGKTDTRLGELAKKYGSIQAAYTAGPGACLNIYLQGQVLVDLVRRMRTHCPDAYLIHGTNPVPGLVMTAAHAGHDPRRILGYCGAMHWYRPATAQFLGDPDPARIDFRIGGTNHCTFFTELRLDGHDAYDQARAEALRRGVWDMGAYGKSTTEINLLRTSGYLVCPGHSSDIFPGLIGDYTPADAPPDGADKTSEWKPGFREVLDAYGRGEDVNWSPPTESELPALWLDALAGAAPLRTHSVNMINLNAVPNLPSWTVPDLEVIMDRRGVTPLANPPYPEFIAEVTRSHQVTFDLAARAAVSRDRRLLAQAIQLCPFGDYLAKADAMIDEARTMFGDLLPV